MSVRRQLIDAKGAIGVKTEVHRSRWDAHLEPRMIRLAQAADLPVIVDIYNASIPSRLATADTEPVSVESRVAWLRDREPRHPVWVLERDACVLGWLSLAKFYGRPAYAATAEIGFYVAPAAQLWEIPEAGHTGEWRHGNEMKESVQSKDQEDETEKETSDDRSNFHGKVCLI